jgi:hypothetical protein
MDLDTFLTTVYVLVDDWYKEQGMEAYLKRHPGAAERMSDSEVLTVALAGQWRVGVPWQSERGVVRYMRRHGRGWFPQMLERSGFNERVRKLWGAFILLQQQLAQHWSATTMLYECVDCVPLPACSSAQGHTYRRHWLESSQVGYGGNQGEWFFGEQLLVAVLPDGMVTGWLIGPASADDRWLMEAFVSQRAGHMTVRGPARDVHQVRQRDPQPPTGPIGPCQSAGQGHPRPYLADQGFNGERWRYHWWHTYHAQVLTIPPANTALAWSSASKRWLNAHRQIIETTFARLDGVFGLKRLLAHSRWGQYTRVAAKLAAYNIGLLINHLLGRPLGALATLLC